MPKLKPTDIILIDFDHTLVNIHLSNELMNIFNSNTMGKINQSIRVYDSDNIWDQTHLPLLTHAQAILVQRKTHFNDAVFAKILDAFKENDQKIAIVTFSFFPDIIYELIREKLSSYNIPLFSIFEKLKVIGGFPNEGQDSSNRKQEHVIKALTAFDAIPDNINADNILDLFKGVTLIDDSRENIEQALRCGMNAILVKKDGTLNTNPITGTPPPLQMVHLISHTALESESYDNVLIVEETSTELSGGSDDDNINDVIMT